MYTLTDTCEITWIVINLKPHKEVHLATHKRATDDKELLYIDQALSESAVSYFPTKTDNEVLILSVQG